MSSRSKGVLATAGPAAPPAAGPARTPAPRGRSGPSSRMTRRWRPHRDHRGRFEQRRGIVTERPSPLLSGVTHLVPQVLSVDHGLDERTVSGILVGHLEQLLLCAALALALFRSALVRQVDLCDGGMSNRARQQLLPSDSGSSGACPRATRRNPLWRCGAHRAGGGVHGQESAHGGSLLLHDAAQPVHVRRRRPALTLRMISALAAVAKDQAAVDALVGALFVFGGPCAHTWNGSR